MDYKPKEFFIKAIRNKWDSRKVRLNVGDKVAICLKSQKVLRGTD